MTAHGVDSTARPANVRRKSTDERFSRALSSTSRSKSQVQIEGTARKPQRKTSGKSEARTEHPGDVSESNWTSASPASSVDDEDDAGDEHEAPAPVQRTDKATTMRPPQAAAQPPTPHKAEAPPPAETPRRRGTPSHAKVSTGARPSEPGPLSPKTTAPSHADSPASVRSHASVRSSRSMIFGRNGLQPSAPVHPVLDTHRVTSQPHGTATDAGTAPSQAPSRFYLEENDETRMPSSQPYMRSLGSTSNLTLEEMSREQADTPNFSRSRVDSMTSLNSLTGATSGMRRTNSTQSLNEAQLHKSTSSREQLAHLLHRTPVRRDSALRSVTGDHSGPVRVGASGSSSKLVANTFAHMLQVGPVERPAKPIVSKFAGYQQQFDPAASAQHLPVVASQREEVPGRVVSVDVPVPSVFSAGFVERIKARMEHRPLRETHDDMAHSPPQYRYLLDYGLSGPSIDKAALSHVELTPRLESGLPLGDIPDSPVRLRSGRPSVPRRADSHDTAKLVVPDSVTTLAPNMIPFHFIHALTSAMENALALDHAEVPAMASLLPGVAEKDEGLLPASPPSSGSEVEASSDEEEHVHYIDNQSMRAIAYTAQAVSIQRIHTVTRRFSDPYREAFSRVVHASGYMPYLRAQEQAQAPSPMRRASQAAPMRLTPSGSLWNLSAYVGTGERGSIDAQHPTSRPGLARSNTALAALGNLAQQSNSPRRAPART